MVGYTGRRIKFCRSPEEALALAIGKKAKVGIPTVGRHGVAFTALSVSHVPTVI
jgi:hypothetical protein